MNRSDVMFVVAVGFLIWVIGSMASSFVIQNQTQTVTGKATVLRTYQGDTAPYEILVVNGHNFTVSCDYYKTGDNFTYQVEPSNRFWVFYPLVSTSTPEWIFTNSLPRGCAHI
jgi:hypothetical protein